MGTISNTLSMSDKISPALSAITRAMSSTLSAIKGIENSGLGNVFDAAVSDVNKAMGAVEIFNRDIQATSAVASTASTAVSEASAEIKIIADATARAAKSTEEINKRLSESSEKAANASTAYESYIRRISELENELKGAKDAIDVINKKFTEMDEKTKGSGDGFTILKGMAVSALSAITRYVKETISNMAVLSDELTGVNSRLGLIANTGESVASMQESIFNAAQRAGGAYLDMASSVASLRTNAGEAFKSTEEAVFFAELLNKQFAISGTSASGIQSVMYNITQALSTGVLRGQDLNAVLSNSPTIVQNIADYLGVSIGKVREFAAEGKITADIVKNSLFATADATNAKFAEMPMTIGQIGRTIGNEMLMYFQPAINALGDSARWIYENWDIVGKIAVPAVVALGTAIAITLVPAMIKSVATALQLKGAVFATNAQFAIIGFTLTAMAMTFNDVGEKGKSLQTTIFGISAAVTVATIAVKVFKAQLDIATLGISALISGVITLVAWVTNKKKAVDEAAKVTSESTKADEEQRKMIELSTAAYDEITKSINQSADAVKDYSQSLIGVSSSEFTAALQAQSLVKHMNLTEKTGKINAKSLKELSTQYKYLDSIIPNLAESLGKQNSKTIELLNNANDMTDVALENAAASLNEADALGVLNGAIGETVESYYKFAKAAAFVQAYQSVMSEVATDIIKAELEKTKLESTQKQQEYKAQQATKHTSLAHEVLLPGVSEKFDARALRKTEIEQELKGLGFTDDKFKTHIPLPDLGIYSSRLAKEPLPMENKSISAILETNSAIAGLDNTMTNAYKDLDILMQKMLDPLMTMAEGQDRFTTDGGKSIRTTGDVKIGSEDIKLLLDLSTRGYQITYQTLTPEISVNIDTIRETADVNEIISVIADSVSEMSESSLVFG